MILLERTEVCVCVSLQRNAMQYNAMQYMLFVCMIRLILFIQVPGFKQCHFICECSFSLNTHDFSPRELCPINVRTVCTMQSIFIASGLD